MVNLDYNKLLKRVQDATSSIPSNEERFKIPKFDIFYEGNTTVIRNWDKVVDIINRDPQHLLKYLLGNVGTAGEVQNNRATFQGKIPARMLQDRLEEYINAYVICSECGRPDTNLIKKGRTLLIRCDACGAFHAIGAINKKAKKTSKATILKEGDVLEVSIQDIGKRGDGVAYVDKYIVYVNGAVKGAMPKVRIDKISGTMAFASIVE